MESHVQAIPEKVCLLRLSAIGDTCHVVPLLRTLQTAWPRTRFTWVIGKLEAKLMSLIPDVELITVDKGAGLSAYTRIRSEMKRRGAFDLLLHLQLSLRASAAAAVIPAPVKLGFDRARARELQWSPTGVWRPGSASTSWTVSWDLPTRSASPTNNFAGTSRFLHRRWPMRNNWFRMRSRRW
jgi:hypothetical protein